MNKGDSVEEVLLREGYRSSDDFMRDWALILALSKLERYRAEIDFFEKKYRMTFQEFESLLHDKKGQEDFQKEEDVEDWEFSISALSWWEEKVGELRSAQDT
jgi:hypothetical protein